MYAGTKAYWHEILQPVSSPSGVDESLPLFLCAFSADKGTEKITDLTQADFKAMYGTDASFAKHGQPLIQAHAILGAGGRVLGKRLVADDATLANLVINVKVSQSVTTGDQAKDSSGNLLYLDAEGNDTTTVTDTPKYNSESKALLTYSASSVTGATSYDQVVAQVEKDFEAKQKAGTVDTFPIFIICDNGRGVTVKNVRIAPDYDSSKSLTYMLYKIMDIEGTNTIESVRFAMALNTISSVNGVSKDMALTEYTCDQFNACVYDAARAAFVTALATASGYSEDEINALDMLFGKTNRGASLETIVVDDTGLNINNTYGLELQSGTNGAFGDAPFAGTVCSSAWEAAAIKFFNGDFSEEIFDLDQHKIDYCVDANYPFTVKSAIVSLAKFRQDFFYFRDLGLNIKTLADVQDIVSDPDWEQTPFVGDYMTTYDIIDSFTKKQIKVTMLYGMAPLLVNHYSTNVAAPMAGEFNNFTITNAIDNTVTFIPRITPSVNQKEILDELKVNYANYSSNGVLTIQSTYTSQDHWGPLSYSSNVLVTQMCVKAIRRYCPKIRFMLNGVGATDFTEYKKLIEDNVISKFTKYFKSISLVYTRDDEMIAAKTFNASLYCYYQDFVQGEIFDVFAMEGSPDNNPISSVSTSSYTTI